MGLTSLAGPTLPAGGELSCDEVPANARFASVKAHYFADTKSRRAVMHAAVQRPARGVMLRRQRGRGR
jgi:hypothetical protein